MALPKQDKITMPFIINNEIENMRFQLGMWPVFLSR
jgi:hypothetical protein